MVELLPLRILSVIKEYNEAVGLIHLSDQNTLSNLSVQKVPKKILRFKFNLSYEIIFLLLVSSCFCRKLHGKPLTPLVELVFAFIDLVSDL